MISIKNFLSKEICNHCINFFNTYESRASFYQKRKKIHVLNMLNLDPKIDQLVDKYKEIYPGHHIKNFEILKWPVGEYHDWHDDTDYYNKTTITYLNQEYDGGRTIVGNYTVKPETGKIILFNSNIKHKVLPLIKGDRYVMLVWYNIKMNKK
jgi:hypothetical protein|tara:strand:- start:278 stop:733 length:456 start_codon:yes stop_codon:yes gene_type:complete